MAIVRTLQCVASGGVVCKVRPTRLSDASGTDRHGPVEEAGPAPVAARRRIGNRFPPPPLFLHDPGRFEGTQVDSSRLDGCQQTLDVERVRPQTTRRQSVTETRAHGFDSRRLHRYRALQSVPHPTRWQEITQSARADLDWPTTRPHEWDTRTSASQIRCSTSAATRTRILPSSNSPVPGSVGSVTRFFLRNQRPCR